MQALKEEVELSFVNLGLSRQNLRSDYFQFLPGSAWKHPDYLSRYWIQLANSWKDLESDKYMKTGDNFRYRRFGRFEYNDLNGHVKPILDNTFWQTSAVNSYAGDLKREFCYLAKETYDNQFLHYIISSSLHHFIESYGLSEQYWDITLHQFRIIAKEGQVGMPTPEGIHQDGHRFVSMHLIQRKNVSGGVSTMYDLDKDKVEELTLKHPMDSLFIDDEQLFHSVSPIRQKEPDEIGYRDILVIDYNVKNKEVK